MSTKKAHQQKKKGKEPRPPLPPGTKIIAHAQASAFAVNAEYLATQMTTPPHPGIVTAYLVNAGFAVELYLKLFMIMGRNGHISEGHSLPLLLQEMPKFLRKSFREIYDLHPTAKTAKVRLVAMTIGAKGAPSEPYKGRFGTFDEAISAIANVFVYARYYFEKVRTDDHAILAVPIDAISAILVSLEQTFQKFDANEFTSTDPDQLVPEPAPELAE